MKNIRDSIIKEIKDVVDEKYRDFHSGLCPGTENILGVRVPKLREYGKQLAKQDNWEEIYYSLKNEYYEEIMIKGIMIGSVKTDFDTRLQLLTEFIPHIENWAECDCTCSGLKFIKKNKKEFWKFLQPYLKSKKEYEVRFAVVVLLNYYIDDEYIDKVIEELEKIDCTKYYYIKMAVAWAISFVYIKYPEKGLQLLKNISIDDDTINKSIQKILDSFRVSSKDKETAKKLRRQNKI